MKLKFVPQNIEVNIDPGQSVLEAAHNSGVPIKSTCNGMPSCAECRVKVVDGEYNLLPPSKKELNLIGTGYYIDQRRLSCQMYCFGDVTVDTAEHMESANEGPITKKFLSRVHKSSAQESHSVGGVLIEQEESELKQISETVKTGGSNDGEVAAADFLGIEHSRRERERQQHQNRPHQGGGGGGGERSGGGGRGRNRRGRRR